MTTIQCGYTHISEADRDGGEADKTPLLGMRAARVDKVPGEHADEMRDLVAVVHRRQLLCCSGIIKMNLPLTTSELLLFKRNQNSI